MYEISYFVTTSAKYWHKPIFGDGPYNNQGGAAIFLKKRVCFPTGSKKIKCLQRS